MILSCDGDEHSQHVINKLASGDTSSYISHVRLVCDPVRRSTLIQGIISWNPFTLVRYIEITLNILPIAQNVKYNLWPLTSINDMGT